jgi:hypothetical protein
MNKKVIPFILSIALIFTAIFFYYNYTNKSVNTDNAINSGDAQLINNVVEIEKNLVLTQSRKMSFNDFESKTIPYIHSYYQESYFDNLEKEFNGMGYLAESTKTPAYQYISKVYTDSSETIKNIYIKIPVEETTTQLAKSYIFKKENGEWKVFSVSNYILVISKNEPKKIIEKFTNYNGSPIEYEYIKILE